MDVKDIRVTKFIKALWTFYKSGKGYLPKAKIEERFAICKACDKFTGTRCMVCGCGLNTKKSLLNKLCYPTEQCPADPPKWLKQET